ncbi:MAG: twin-arginine translocation signal domain-containing protein, partial [Candidatus Zixiibacteriota bacterium]
MEINRRGFLKTIGAAGAGCLVGSSQKALAQEHFPGHPDRFGVLTDLTRCVGCRTCEAACNRINNL